MGDHFKSPFSRSDLEQINVLREKVAGRDLDIPSVNPFRRVGQGIVSRLTAGIIPEARPGPFDEFAFDEGEAGVAQRERFGEMSPLQQQALQARTPAEFTAILQNDNLFTPKAETSPGRIQTDVNSGLLSEEFGQEFQANQLAKSGMNSSDLVKYSEYDADSPTLVSNYIVSKSTGEKRFIGHGNPADETTITSPDGTIVRMGQGTPGDLTKKALGRVQSDLIDAGDGFARFGRIAETFNAEMLTYGSRAAAKGFAFAEKLGVDIGPDNRGFLTQYTNFRTDTLKNINRTISEITGAAMSEPEAKRIQGELPLLTDSKTVFTAKMNRAFEELDDMNDRRMHMLAFGITDRRKFTVPTFKRSRNQLLDQFKAETDPSLSDEERTRAAIDRYNKMVTGQ